MKVRQVTHAEWWEALPNQRLIRDVYIDGKVKREYYIREEQAVVPSKRRRAKGRETRS